MNYRRAIEKLGFRQKAYKTAFGTVGSPQYLALLDLADYCAAWRGDSDNIGHDMVMQMTGRRQAFFRVFNHLNLNQTEIETVYKGALVRAAERLNVPIEGDS
jgi:hypothetical protein